MKTKHYRTSLSGIGKQENPDHKKRDFTFLKIIGAFLVIGLLLFSLKYAKEDFTKIKSESNGAVDAVSEQNGVNSPPTEILLAPKLCNEDWQCEDWTECTNGEQTRLCVEKDKCGEVTFAPAYSRKCVSTNL